MTNRRRIIAKELTDEQRSKILEDFGKKEEKMRMDKEMTQQEVADRLDIPRSGVSLMEDGQRGVDLAELLMILKLFNKEPHELLTTLMKYVNANVRNSHELHADSDITQPDVYENRTGNKSGEYSSSNPESSRSSSLYAPISAVLEEAEALGIGMANCTVQKEPVLSRATGSASKTLCKATICFSAPTNDARCKRLMMDWVDGIVTTWPASKCHMELDVDGVRGSNQLNFLTISALD